MNKVILMGRLVRDPEIRYSQGGQQTAVCRYNLAVNRSYKRDGEQEADFINIIALGNRGEFANKYFRKGQQVAVVGAIRTGSYTNKDGQKIYTTDVIAEEQFFAGNNTQSTTRNDFAQTNEAAPNHWQNPPYQGTQQRDIDSGFMPIDDEIEGDGDLPF